MRFAFLGNNWLGWKVLEWLRLQPDELVALVVHPDSRSRHRAEIQSCSGLDGSRIFEGPDLEKAEGLERIRALRPEIGVSVMFGQILRSEFLKLFPRGCVNLHPGLLPYGRGAYPNVWSIVERTPAGVTLHRMDQGVDTGEILGQREVVVEPVDTGETLYRKLERAGLEVFQELWPLVRKGELKGRAQPSGEGTAHRARDVDRIDEIDLDKRYTARDLIDLLRARTFPPYPGSYFVEGGRRVYIRVEMSYEDGSRPGELRR